MYIANCYKQIALFTVDEYSSSEGGRREGLSDSSNSASSDLLSLATPAEKYLHGLLMGRDHSRSNVTIKEVEGRGRSAFANKNFSAGDFVCEYSSNVRIRSMPDIYEERNEELRIGCYCLDACYQGTMYTFDATSKVKDPGGYINHASKHCNLVKMKPVMIGNPPDNRLRIGFVAKTTIKKGEELFFDYGIRDSAIPWLVSDAKKIGTTVTELSEQSIPSKKRVYQRIRKDCPIPNCKSKQLLRLSCHLRVTHKIKNKVQRRKWLQKAKEVANHIYCITMILNYTTLS